MKTSSAVLSTFFAAAFAAFAQTNVEVIPTRAMSLQDCFQESLAHNLGLQIDRLDPQISLYALDSAYAGYDPTLSFSATSSHSRNGPENAFSTASDGTSLNSSINGSAPWGMGYTLSSGASESPGVPTPNSSGQLLLSLKQPVLKNFLIDSTRLTVSVNKNLLKQSEQTLRGLIITTVTEVENAYYGLISAQENVRVQKEALDLAQTQLDQDRQRVQLGSLAPLDVQQDESLAAQSKADLITASNTLSQAQNTLKSLLTEDYSKWHGTDIQPTATLEAPLQLFDLQDSWNTGLSERPDLLQAKLAVDQQGITLKYDRNQLFPELDLIGTFGYNGTGEGYTGTYDQIGNADRPAYSYGAQLSFPLSNLAQRNAYKTSKANMQKAVLQVKQTEQTIMVDIDNAVKSAQSAYESVDATKQARIYAEAALDAEQKKYAVGKSTTFTVLQLQKNLTAARSGEITALAAYNEALANLAAAEGSSLERDKISIEAK